jgi:excisionase family DNA binding protein
MLPGRGLRNGSVTSTEGPNYLTTDEVAEELRIPRRQVYELIHREGLPAVRLSHRAYRIVRDEYEKWLKARRAS